MRNLTKSIFGVVSLGVLASSYSIGLANQVPNALTAEPSVAPSTASPMPTFNAPDDDEFEEDDDEYEEEDDEQVAPSATASPSSSPSTTSPKTTAAPTNTKAPTTKPTASPTATKATPAPAPTGATGTGTGVGDELFYKYGSIQLQAVKAGGSLSEVIILKATVRGNEWAGVPAELAQAAVAANGTKFANISGATFTSNAFRKSLESALAAL